MPVRTEEEVLKEIGGRVVENGKRYLVISFGYEDSYWDLVFDKLYKSYHTRYHLETVISMQQHKLLTELFTIWGWLKDKKKEVLEDA